MTIGEFLRSQALRVQAEVTIGWLAAQAGAVLPGLMLVLTAMPSLLPVPGVGNITGSALVLLAVSIWRGQSPTHLPRRVSSMRVPARQAARLLRLLAWMHECASRHLRPRLLACVGPRAWAWSALPVAAMGVIIFLPIPLGNVFGALALMALGLGHSVEDGLVVAVAWVLAALTMCWALTLAWGLSALGGALWSRWLA